MDHRKILKYPEQNMLDAVEAVNRGMSYKAAAKMYSVPRITLMRKHKGTVPLKRKMGPEGTFTSDQEAKLVEWVKTMATAGFPLTKYSFLGSVAKLAEELNVTFKGNATPGKKWMQLFLKRHPNISFRVCQNLTAIRKGVSQENINKWFLEVETYLKDKHLLHVLDDPRRVFNADETAFFLNPKIGKVLAAKGSKSVYTASGNDEKFNVTTLLTANAMGQIAPPLVVYRYSRIPQHIAETFPADWSIGKSLNGWMTQELFFEYIANIFLPWIKKEGIELPVLFFMDGHTSHISFQLSKFCVENKIELVALYPNSTHILQPMDVAVFHALKSAWKQKVQEWRIENNGEQLKKHHFAPVLKEVLPSIKKSTIASGFKKCGLVPWDPKNVVVDEQPLNEFNTPTMNHEERVFLLILEREIGSHKLDLFINTEGEWEGDIADSSLYSLWKKYHRKKQAFDKVQSNRTTEAGSSSKEVPVISTTAQMNPNADMEPASTEQSSPSSTNMPMQRTPSKMPSPNINVEHTPSSHTDFYPSPFKRALRWIQTDSKAEPVKRRREILPAVATSPQMLEYFKRKEDNKKKIELDKQQRKLAREEKKRSGEKKAKDAQEKRAQKMATRNREESTSSSSSQSNYSLHGSSQSECEEDDESSNEENVAPIYNFNDLKEGDYVLAEFKGGKRNTTIFRYLCVINTLNSPESIIIMGYKSTDNLKKEFVANDKDISEINLNQIVSRLQPPKLIVRGERLSYTFEKPLNVNS